MELLSHIVVPQRYCFLLPSMSFEAQDNGGKKPSCNLILNREERRTFIVMMYPGTGINEGGGQIICVSKNSYLVSFSASEFLVVISQFQYLRPILLFFNDIYSFDKIHFTLHNFVERHQKCFFIILPSFFISS